MIGVPSDVDIDVMAKFHLQNVSADGLEMFLGSDHEVSIMRITVAYHKGFRVIRFFFNLKYEVKINNFAVLQTVMHTQQ